MDACGKSTRRMGGARASRHATHHPWAHMGNQPVGWVESALRGTQPITSRDSLFRGNYARGVRAGIFDPAEGLSKYRSIATRQFRTGRLAHLIFLEGNTIGNGI
jgi:hypothetical protein